MVQSLHTARRPGQPLILLGYSLGAAIAISAATAVPVDGLLLISPFWRLGSFWQDQFWPVLRLLFRTVQPFKNANFADPVERQNIQTVLPEADLDDAATQQALRQFAVPRQILDQVRAVGKRAYANAPSLNGPGLVVQGSADEVVQVASTQQLTARLGQGFQYAELATDHQFIRPENDGFFHLSRSILHYLDSIQAYDANHL